MKKGHLSPVVIVLMIQSLLALGFGLTACTDKQPNVSISGNLYETVKINDQDLKKVTVYCPGEKPKKFLALGRHNYLEGGIIRFVNYDDGSRIETSCPFFSHQIRTKKKFYQPTSMEAYLNDDWTTGVSDKSTIRNEDQKSRGDEKIIINNNVNNTTLKD